VASPEEKENIPDLGAEKTKEKNEQVNQDAIKKEDEELAEAEKQAQADNEQKHEELLRKLEKHKEEQKKLLQEQKQILEELKEHKKDIEEAVAKHRNDDHVPQGLPDKVQRVTVKPGDTKSQSHDKNQSINLENISVPPLVKILQNNLINITTSLNKTSRDQKTIEKGGSKLQPVKSDPPKKAAAGERPDVANEIRQRPRNASNLGPNGSESQQTQGL
jgi:chromosome segregation ATPase